ncbi:MAG TPA: response regulator [Salinivirgaceae bacterium]|nr:response regulator [Salinivirgaceae bacterium]
MEQFKKILVVDDSPTSLYLLENMFQGNYLVITAASGEAAIKYLETNTPDLILLDIMMPHISGIDVLERIRKTERLKDLPVIIISAITDEIYIEKARNLGVNHYVTKPINVEELIQLVSNLLKTPNNNS